MISWSPSRIADFSGEYGCPKMFWHKYVAPKGSPERIKPEPQTPQQAEGDRVHKALEKRVANGVPLLPADAERYESMCVQLASAPGQTLTEFQMAVDADLKPCGYKDWDRAYARAIADLLKMNGGAAFALDYKTGKPQKNEFQLKLTAAMLMGMFTHLEKVTTAYAWINHGNLFDTEVYYRSALPQMWDSLLVVPRQIQEAEVMNHWAPNPGRKCAWCPVNRERMCPAAREAYRGR